MAPARVPMWRATSKALARESSPAKSSQPNSHGTIARCPDEEIGMNSESPWTMPRTMACRRGKGGVLASGEGHAGNQQRDATGAAGLPLDVGTHVGDVEEEALQRAGERGLLDRL